MSNKIARYAKHPRLAIGTLENHFIPNHLVSDNLTWLRKGRSETTYRGGNQIYIQASDV